MAKYKVTSPSGQVIRVEANSPEEARALAQSSEPAPAREPMPEGVAYTTSFPDVLRGYYDAPPDPQLGPQHPGYISAPPPNVGDLFSPAAGKFLGRAQERSGMGTKAERAGEGIPLWKQVLDRMFLPFNIAAEGIDTAGGNPGGWTGPAGVPASAGDMTTAIGNPAKLGRGAVKFVQKRPVNPAELFAEIKRNLSEIPTMTGAGVPDAVPGPRSTVKKPILQSTGEAIPVQMPPRYKLTNPPPPGAGGPTSTTPPVAPSPAIAGEVPPRYPLSNPRPVTANEPASTLPPPPAEPGIPPRFPLSNPRPTVPGEASSTSVPADTSSLGYAASASTALGAAAAGVAAALSPNEAEAGPKLPNRGSGSWIDKLLHKSGTVSARNYTAPAKAAQQAAPGFTGGTHFGGTATPTFQIPPMGTGGTVPPLAAAMTKGANIAEPLRDQGTWQKFKDKLPQDYAVWRVRPESGAITSVGQSEYIRDALWRKANRLEGIRDITKLPEQDWVAAEQAAFDVFKLTGDMKAARATMPQAIREVSEFIEKLRPAEKKYANLLGDRTLKDEPAYFLPHVRADYADEAVSIDKRARMGYATGWRSTLGAFEKERSHATMEAGIKAGEEYLDPRKAVLLRMWASTRLISTGRYVESLLQTKTLFEKADDAAKLSPTGKAFEVDIIPGGKKFYTPTRQEALHIKHQLAEEKDPGTLAGVAHAGTWFLRNLNLANPWPHFLKNMVAKYNMSGGNLTKIRKDIAEYNNQTNPQLLAEFQQFLPTYSMPRPDVRNVRMGMWKGQFLSGKTARRYFDEIEGGNAWENFSRANRKLDWNNALFKLRDIAEGPQRSSGAMIFGWMDPGLKYSRFKQYRLKGLSAQEAATQTQLDLIRYSTRSELMDMWKSIPLNFFTPWRVGTVTSLYKNFRAHPVRTAIWMASVDMLREAVYRSTGEWVHMPHDYVEGPVGDFIDAVQHGHGTTSAIRLLGTTRALGPGGGHALHLANSILKALETGEMDPETVQRAFWGLAFVADPKEFLENIDKGLSGDVGALARAIGQYGLASHAQLNSPPKRVLGKVAGDILGMPKSPMVEQAEYLSETKGVKRDLRKERQRQYPYPKTEDIVKGLR